MSLIFANRFEGQKHQMHKCILLYTATVLSMKSINNRYNDVLQTDDMRPLFFSHSCAHLFKPVIVRFLRDPVLCTERFVRQSAAFTLLYDLRPLL